MTSNESNPWTTIACYCRELAPISGPLLDCIGQTAAAIHRAGARADLPAARLNLISESLLTPEDDER
jgi:hypothetical protein